MAKWYGKIGFVETKETSPGVWEGSPTERTYYGELNRVSRRYQSSNGLNDNIVLNNELSVLIDPFMNKNLGSVRYVEFMGAKWKVSNAEVQRPRLVLTLGDKYNA